MRVKTVVLALSLAFRSIAAEGQIEEVTLYAEDFDAPGAATWWRTFHNLGPGAPEDWRGVSHDCGSVSGAGALRFGGESCGDPYRPSSWSWTIATSAPELPPTLRVPLDAKRTTLRFRHRYDFAAGDGAAVYVSLGDEPILDPPYPRPFYPVPPAYVSQGGYTGVIPSSPCAIFSSPGRAVWTGTGTATWTTTSVELDHVCNMLTGSDTGCAGRDVWIGFGTISDQCDTPNGSGWSIDDVEITAEIQDCDPVTLYTDSFSTTPVNTLGDWLAVNLDKTDPNAASLVGWRGVQSCAPDATGDGKVFRFGGPTCSTGYPREQFNLVQPRGHDGIAIPAGVVGTRLSFYHRYAFYQGAVTNDGATLLLSFDGREEYSPVLAEEIGPTGGGPYNATHRPWCNAEYTNQIPPLQIWTGQRAQFNGPAARPERVIVDLEHACQRLLGEGCAGHTLQVGFTVHTCNDNLGGGWFIDGVRVTGCRPRTGYYTTPPCRSVDTRAAGSGGPLRPNEVRRLAVAGSCGVPAAGVASVSSNVTVTEPQSAGDLRLFPGGESAAPLASTINFGSGQTRANNAIIALAADGSISVRNDSLGSVHVILDVSGWFQ